MKIILIAKYVTVVTVAFTFSKQNKTNFKTSYPLYGVSQSPTSQLMEKALGLKHTEINIKMMQRSTPSKPVHPVKMVHENSLPGVHLLICLLSCKCRTGTPVLLPLSTLPSPVVVVGGGGGGGGGGGVLITRWNAGLQVSEILVHYKTYP